MVKRKVGQGLQEEFQSSEKFPELSQESKNLKVTYKGLIYEVSKGVSPEKDFKWLARDWLRKLYNDAEECQETLTHNLQNIMTFKDSFLFLVAETVKLLTWIKEQNPREDILKDFSQDQKNAWIEEFKKPVMEEIKNGFFNDLTLLKMDFLLNSFPEEKAKGLDLFQLFKSSDLINILKFYPSEEMYGFLQKIFGVFIVPMASAASRPHAYESVVTESDQHKTLVEMLVYFCSFEDAESAVKKFLVEFYMNAIDQEVPDVDSKDKSGNGARRENIKSISRCFAESLSNVNLPNVDVEKFQQWKAEVLNACIERLNAKVNDGKDARYRKMEALQTDSAINLRSGRKNTFFIFGNRGRGVQGHLWYDITAIFQSAIKLTTQKPSKYYTPRMEAPNKGKEKESPRSYFKGVFQKKVEKIPSDPGGSASSSTRKPSR